MITHDAPPAPDQIGIGRELVRHAVMAASSHNTQPWKFALTDTGITVVPDWSRRTPVVDPDNHHLFVSLGCATENLAHAALANGLHAEISTATDRIDLIFEKTRPVRSPLFDVIPSRQCSRSVYNGTPVSTGELGLLEQAARASGVEVIVLTDRARMEAVLEYVVRGNEAQIGDAVFIDELRNWIRFNKGDAARTRDGLFSGCAGNPSVPRWVGRRLLGLLLSTQSENEKAATHVRSSAGLAVFVAQSNDPPHWVEVGRAYERFALQATALGIRNTFLNQPVEVPSLRLQFAKWLGVRDRRPDLIVRFGRGPEMPRSLRRPVEDVLIPRH
jgi:hypothetical protein